MSEQNPDLDSEPQTDTDSEPNQEAEDLAARVRDLEAENDRLRQAVEAATQARYRRSALVMGVVGLLALGGAALFPDVRTILLALGGTGVFAAILTYFLTPERFVAASVGEAIYATLADNEGAIAHDLDLRGDPHYIPGRGAAAPARLFIPLDVSVDIPDATDQTTPFGIDDKMGLFVQPTGVPLYESFRDATGQLPEAPDALARNVGDALVEQFELVDSVDIDTETGRATLAADGSVYGPLDRFDHPVASLLATTLAVELDTPILVDVPDTEDGRPQRVTCRWATSDDESLEAQRSAFEFENGPDETSI